MLILKGLWQVHGILDSALALFHLRDAIEDAHPGTQVYMLPIFQDMKSAWPMWTQVLGFGNAIQNISDIHKDQGINIIGYSQGGLISRGVIQVSVRPNKTSFKSFTCLLKRSSD
jgi:palmitoyl-protein thioesterase